MTKDEKTLKARKYMERLVKKIELDQRGSLSYREKLGLGMFDEIRAGLHISGIYPEWPSWDEKKKGETLKSLSATDLRHALECDDDNATPLLFSVSNEDRFALLEKLAKADIIFETLSFMVQENRYGENILELASLDKVYGPKMGQLFGELKQKASKYKLIHNYQKGLKKKKKNKEENSEETSKQLVEMKKKQRSY